MRKIIVLVVVGGVPCVLPLAEHMNHISYYNAEKLLHFYHRRLRI